MGMLEDFLDPGYRDRAKRKIRELEDIADRYRALYSTYESEIDELNNAKVVSAKVIDAVKEYINSIANKPKEIDSVLVTPDIEQANYESDIETEKMKYNRGVKTSKAAGVLGLISVVYLPAAIVSIPVMWVTGKKEKKNNLKIIDECNQKIAAIMKETDKIQSVSHEIVTEQEFLIVYSNNIKALMNKMKTSGVYDYSKISDEQKSDLGALINSTKTLIRRLDGRV